MKKIFSSRAFYIFYLIGITVLILFAFNSYKAIRFHEIYVTYERWPDGSREYNEKAGFEMTPSFSGEIKSPHLFDLKTHALGYRIPKSQNANSFHKGGILFAGCSFTFGDEVNAEEAYPDQTGKFLQMPVYNYGVCGYSYTNALLQLQDLSERGVLDSLQPSFLVLGAGDWLIDRSLSPFYPTAHLQLAYPYLKKNNDSIAFAYPSDFYSIRHLYELKEKYGETKVNKDLSFSRFTAMSQLVPRVIWANYKNKTWQPSSISSSELYDFVFSELEKIQKRHHIQSIIVLWMTTEENSTIDSGLVQAAQKHSAITLINGKEALDKHHVKPEYYTQGHPKNEAHAVYAEEVSNVIAEVMIQQGISPTLSQKE